MRIAVLRGGPSNHYDTSLGTGEFVLSVLREEPEKYRPLDIFISKDGEWHMMGKVCEPHHVLRHVDLVWNALHGEYGEDGKLNQLLSKLNIPYTGSSALHLALAMNKDLSKAVFEANDLPTPRHRTLLGDASHQDLLEIFREYLHPVMIKPVKGRENLGIKRAGSFEELQNFVAEAFKHADRVLVEELVRGEDVRCAVVENLRGKKLYTFLPDPAKFKSETHKEIEHMAERAHLALGLRHYSSSDFVVTPKGKVYLLETNALPSLTHNSHLHQSFKSVGLSPKEFVSHIVSIAV